MNTEDLVWEEGEMVRATVYKLFYKEFSKEVVEEAVGPFSIEEGKIIVKEEKKVWRWIQSWKHDLVYALNGNRVYFIDEDLPLIGLNFLGITDKGSEMIEVKPITNCNADCSFCSVNEGSSSDKQVDFVVDKEYLVQEVKAVLAWKGASDMSVWFNPHGEPTLYAPLIEVCDEISKDDHVKDIHIITNGLLLNKKKVDALAALKKPVKLSVSMSGLSKEAEEKSKVNKQALPLAEATMGKGYNVDLVLRNVEYAASKLEVTITPVLVEGLNTSEMGKLVDLAKNLGVKIMIQKFCKNKRGRNPIKEGSWEQFYETLKALEEEKGVDLTQPLGKVQETKELPCSLEKNQKIKVQIFSPSRYYKDKIGIVDVDGGKRAVTVLHCPSEKGTVNATVVQAKHNVVVAK